VIFMGVILITGGAKRIGKAIALAVANQHKIIIHYHHSEIEANDVAHAIINAGGHASTLQQDLTDNNAAETLFKNAIKIYGTVDSIINSASLFLSDTMHDLSHDLWQQHQAIHVTVPMILTHLLTHHIKNHKESKIGTVINMIDQRVKRPTPEFFSYTASKMFLEALTKHCAVACSPYVRVNGISPGSTLPSPRQNEADFIKQAGSTPLGIPVHLSDITNAVTFILNSTSITGEIITLDSGQNFDWRTQTFLTCKE
jgi:NAD(P)-dependent dehydrogenase (short-subunit alcohol dehydrogenase family)